MKSATDLYLNDTDILAALSEATDRLGAVYWLDIVRDKAGQVGVRILNTETETLAQFIPVNDPSDLARMVRVYSEVYGCLAGSLHFDDLTPRGQAIVICKQARAIADLPGQPDGRVLDYAGKAGVRDAAQILGTPPNYDALEARLAGIKYLILRLSMPAEAAKRAMSMPKKIMDELGIFKIRPVPEE